MATLVVLAATLVTTLDLVLGACKLFVRSQAEN